MSAFEVEQGPQGETGAAGLASRTVMMFFDPFIDAATGDGQAHFFVPADMDGWNLTAVAAGAGTVGTSGTTLIQVRNATQGADMLTTRITIDPNEDHSKNASTPVIDAANDDVAYGDKVMVDIDSVSTGTRGLSVYLTFTAP